MAPENKRKFHIHLEPELADYIEGKASQGRRSITEQFRIIIEEYKLNDFKNQESQS